MHTNKVNILLVEDNPGDALLIQEALRESQYKYDHLMLAGCIKDAEDFSNSDVEIVLLDLSLPDSDGLETVNRVREIFPQSALIILTGLDSENIAIETLRMGAQNYLNKNEVDPRILERTIRFSLERHLILTKLQQVDRELLESKYFLEKAQEISHLGSWVLDLNTKSVMWSDELYRIYGIDSNEVPSTELFIAFMHPEDSTFAQEQVTKALSTLSTTSFEFRFIRKDGATRYGFTDARFEFDENKNPRFLYGIIQDITQEKQAAEERDKITNDIIQRNKDLEQFAYIVSHNLRLPVANIIGFTDVMQNAELDETEKAQCLTSLHSSAQLLDGVVRDLNHVLQVRREINESREEVVLSDLVDSITNSIQDIVRKEEASLIKDFTAFDKAITIKSYLYSIFFNLIINSIKYRKPSVKPEILMTSSLEKDKVILTFKDNGSGIDLQKYQDQIFGMYKRFHPQTEGKGMGLFMVRTQVESLGGKIKVNSEVNRGTEFKIEFQLSQLI